MKVFVPVVSKVQVIVTAAGVVPGFSAPPVYVHVVEASLIVKGVQVQSAPWLTVTATAPAGLLATNETASAGSGPALVTV